jgi:hypothetical protein
MRSDVLGEARLVGDLLDKSLGPPQPDGALDAESEVVLQQGAHAARHRHDADLGLIAEGAALAPDPELSHLPEGVLGGQVAQLADAEAGVEQRPDDELRGRRLTGVGEPIGLLGGERLAGPPYRFGIASPEPYAYSRFREFERVMVETHQRHPIRALVAEIATRFSEETFNEAKNALAEPNPPNQRLLGFLDAFIGKVSRHEVNSPVAGKFITMYKTTLKEVAETFEVRLRSELHATLNEMGIEREDAADMFLAAAWGAFKVGDPDQGSYRARLVAMIDVLLVGLKQS